MTNYTRIMKVFGPLIQILWPVQIIDRNKFVEGRGIYICNHYSAFDSLHLVTELFKGRTNMLIKEEAMKTYVGIKFLNYMGAVPIKREAVDLRAIKRCLNILRQDKPLVIFPEGTRNKRGDKTMGEIKDGTVTFAIKTKVPIYPMMYYKPIKLFTPTYLLIGDKIDMTPYYGERVNDVREEATELVRQSLANLRVSIDSIVENKNNLKIAKREDKDELKRMRKADRLASKLSRIAKRDSKTAKIEVIGNAISKDNEVN